MSEDQEALWRSTLSLDRTLNAVDQAIVVTDAAGAITFWNRAAERLYGWAAEEVLGRQILDVTPARHVVGEAADIMASLQGGESWVGDMILRRKDGETFLARVTDTPVLDDEGTVVAIIGISEDVTDARWAQQALRASEQRLRLALGAGALGVWQWDRRTGVVEWDQQMERLFGLEPGSHPQTFDAFVELVHPDDRGAVVERIERALAEGEEYRVEHRTKRPDGTIRWIEGHGQPLWDRDELAGLVGVSADVTARREADADRRRLLDQERQARAEAEAARARLAFLVGASEVLHETLELDDRLRSLARLVVPKIADACSIHLLDEHRVPHVVAVHHVDPLQERALRDLVDRYPVRLDAPFGAGAAIRDGAVSRVPSMTDEMLEAFAVDDRHLELLRSLDVTAGVSVPLFGRSVAIGAVTFFTTGERRLDDEDARLALELCARAGTSIDNAQLLQARQQVEAASRYQAALLGAIYESSIDGMLVVDPAGAVLSYNQRFLELWEVGAEVLRDGDEALLDHAMRKVADPEAFIAGVRDAYQQRPVSVHAEVLLGDGRVLDRYGSALRADDGDYLGFAWNFRDITVERRQQAEIIRAGERFAALARTLQQSLLPPRLPSLPGIELAARYHPALDGLEVGGDFYDVFAVGDDWMLVIGDVCGKGAEAAALTALIRYTIRAVAIQSSDPATVLRELNTVMLHDTDTGRSDELADSRFATVCCIRLRGSGDGAAASIACGGHPLPLVLRGDGSVESAGQPGTIVGIVDDVDIATVDVSLQAGDCIVAYTDGVIEARDVSGAELDVDRLTEALRGADLSGAAHVTGHIEATALAWQGGVAHDDIAVLAAAVRTPAS